MDFLIEPFVAVGPIRFGMTRADVRAVLAQPATEFRKTPTSESTTDDFVSLSLHVFYDAADRCKGVEIFAPNSPTVAGVGLIGRPLVDVLENVRLLDANAQQKSSGLLSRVLGISVYAPHAEDLPSEPVESIYAFRRGGFGT